MNIRTMAALVISLAAAAAGQAQQPDHRDGLSQLRPPVGARPESGGIRITQVVPGSPADRAGLERGDIIIEIDGIAIHDLEDLADALQAADGVARIVVQDWRRPGRLVERTVRVQRWSDGIKRIGIRGEPASPRPRPVFEPAE